MASTGTGIVIGSHTLRVIQVKKKGGVPRISHVAKAKLDPRLSEGALDGGKQAQLAQIVGQAVGKIKGEAMLGLTGRDLIIRYTHVPPVPDWRLDMLMSFEIEEVSEQSGGEVSADFKPLDVPDSVSGEKTILVALAKNSSLLPRVDVLSKAGCRVRGGCPNSVALFHAFSTTAKIPSGEVTLLMRVGAENSDIAIQKDGRLLFARNVSLGGKLFTEAIMNQFRVSYDRAEKMKIQKADVTPRSVARYEDSMSEKVSNAVIGVAGQFVSMVHSSVMFCKAQTKMKDLSVDRVVLAGEGARMKGLTEYLSTNLGMPVEVFDPMKAFDLSGLPDDEQALLEAEGTAFAPALGLAAMQLEREAFHLEILPETYKKKRRFMERDVYMIGSAAVVALLLVVLVYTRSANASTALAEGARLSTREKTGNKKKQNLARIQEEYAALQRKYEAISQASKVGPKLEVALSFANDVVIGKGFDEVTIVNVRTSEETKSVQDDSGTSSRSRRGYRGYRGYRGREGKPTKTLHYVDVDFRATIQPRGRRANQVFADFISALKSEIAASPGVSLESRYDQSGHAFQFTLKFGPEAK